MQNQAATALYEKLGELHKTKNHLRAAHIGGYLAAVLIGLFDKKALIVLALLNLAVYLLLLRPPIKRKETEFKRLVAEAQFEGILTDFSYQPKKGVERALLERSGLFDLTNAAGFIGRERMSGAYRGAPFVQSDITLTYKEGTHVTFLVGCWIELELAQMFPISVCLIAEGFFMDSEQQKMSPQNSTQTRIFSEAGLPNGFAVYSGGEAGQVVCFLAQHKQRLEELREACPQPLAVSFHDNRLSVMLKKRFVAANSKLDAKPNPQNTPIDQLPELSAIFALADRFFAR